MKQLTVKEWVETWGRAGVALDQVRQCELRAVSTPRALSNLAGAFEAARRLSPVRSTSGLIQQQALFRKMRP